MFAQEGRKLNSHVQATTGTWKFHVPTHFLRFSSSVKHSSHLFALSRVNPVLHYTQILCVVQNKLDPNPFTYVCLSPQRKYKL